LARFQQHLERKVVAKLDPRRELLYRFPRPLSPAAVVAPSPRGYPGVIILREKATNATNLTNANNRRYVDDMRSRKKTAGITRRASKASLRRKMRHARGAATTQVPRKKGTARKTASAKKVATKLSKAELRRRIVSELEAGLGDASTENVVAVLPRIRLEIRRMVADATRAPETLRGEGLRSANEAEGRGIEASLGRARARGEETVAQILTRPDMLTGEVFADRVGASRETVNRWRNEGRVLGLEGNARGVRYPAWQLDDQGRVLTELPAFLEAVGDPWVAYRFLTAELPELDGQTGLEAVKRGRTAELVDIVRHFGETY
jgi:hypothetical protein